MKLTLNNIVSTQNVQLINDNFQKIEDVINEQMLSRNPQGEPNTLQAPLDLNNQRVLNAPKPTQPTDLVRLQDITSSSGGDVDLSGKQDTLVSGVNIKTVNNESLLGSGNISVSGGSGTSDHSQLLNRTLPDQHNIDSITGLTVALNGKAPATHTHTVANVTGLQTALDGKQPLDGDLTAIAALASNGVPRKTGTDTWAMLVDVKEIVVSTTAPADTTKLWLDIN